MPREPARPPQARRTPSTGPPRPTSTARQSARHTRSSPNPRTRTRGSSAPPRMGPGWCRAQRQSQPASTAPSPLPRRSKTCAVCRNGRVVPPPPRPRKNQGGGGPAPTPPPRATRTPRARHAHASSPTSPRSSSPPPPPSWRPSRVVLRVVTRSTQRLPVGSRPEPRIIRPRYRRDVIDERRPRPTVGARRMHGQPGSRDPPPLAAVSTLRCRPAPMAWTPARRSDFRAARISAGDKHGHRVTLDPAETTGRSSDRSLAPAAWRSTALRSPPRSPPPCPELAGWLLFRRCPPRARPYTAPRIVPTPALL